MVLLLNIRKAWKDLQRTNALAYFVPSPVTKKKKFYNNVCRPAKPLGRTDKLTKTSIGLYSKTNKLVHLMLSATYTLVKYLARSLFECSHSGRILVADS